MTDILAKRAALTAKGRKRAAATLVREKGSVVREGRCLARPTSNLSQCAICGRESDWKDPFERLPRSCCDLISIKGWRVRQGSNRRFA